MTVSMAPVAWTLGLDPGVWHLVTASSTVADPTSVSVDVNCSLSLVGPFEEKLFHSKGLRTLRSFTS
jgi:hypothetical protein